MLKKEVDNLKKQAILDEDKELELEVDLLSSSLASKKEVNKSKHSFQYEDTDKGPYLVFMESKTGNIGNLNPLTIGKIFFENDNFKYNVIKISRKGRNRIGIELGSQADANKFISDETFADYNTYIPALYITVRG